MVRLYFTFSTIFFPIKLSLYVIKRNVDMSHVTKHWFSSNIERKFVKKNNLFKWVKRTMVQA